MKRDVSIVEPGTKSKTRPGFPEKSKIEVQKKQTMKAVALDKFGSPSALTIHELPVPQAGPNEVLIALYASGVGVWDKDIRGGWWPEGMGKPKFPLVLGSDGAGVVAGVGAKVKDFHAGDRVWAYEFINPKGGFYAEYVAVNEQHVALVPKGLDLLHAGAATVTALTALQGIESQLKVRATDTVLIYGASGAVGTSAVQFAKMFGAKVIGTARGTDAQKLVKQLGADLVIDPGEP
ncbi:MAG: NADP-dependent oxidoreductase, partial [Limisphaerales bacterium]